MLSFKEYLTETKSAPKDMEQISAQDLKDTLGKGKFNNLIKNKWFNNYTGYEKAYKYGVNSAGFPSVEMYPYFRDIHVTTDGKTRPTDMIKFVFSYGGSSIIQIDKYCRDKEPNDNEKRYGSTAGWRHVSTLKG